MKTYRIYINDITLYISETVPQLTDEIEQLNALGFDFSTFYHQLSSTTSSKTFLLLTQDPKSLFKRIKASCMIIKAAGGLVESEKGNYLFIFRNKKWDLPKGKIEKGEGMREGAWREVEEECGVKVNTHDEKLCKTYHVYTLGAKIVLKKTNWYRMTVKGEPKLIPQKEEGITKAVWLGKSQLEPVLANTYPSIMDVLEAGALLPLKVL